MQFQSQTLPLFHDQIALDPDFPVSRAGGETHSPDTSLRFLHYHDSLEIGYCYEGNGIFVVDGRIFPFSAGCASVIFRHEIHIARSSAEHVSQWKFINLDPVSLLGRPFPEAARTFEPASCGLVGVVPPDDPSGLAPIVRALIEESPRRDETGKWTMTGLTLCLVAKLAGCGREQGIAASRPSRSSMHSLSPALEAMIRRYAETIYIPELAQACSMSEATFRREFRKSMGMAPNEYIHKLRIQMATIQLLNTADRIVDIAYRVGYDSLSSFSRHFLSVTGTSPREYRKQNRT